MVTVAFERPDEAGVEGFLFRPAMVEDCGEVVDLLNACSMVQAGVEDYTVEGLAGEWAQPGFDLPTSSIVATTEDGRIVGYADVWAVGEMTVKPWVLGRVHPEWEGRGIGTRLLAWAERRARQEIERVPPEARVVMKDGALTTHAASMELLKGYGMTPVRYFWEMGIELDEAPPIPQWPEGITVVTHEEITDARAVYRAYKDSFRDHWDNVPVDEEKDFPLWHYEATSNKSEYDPSLWFLAMDGEEIAGVLLARLRPQEDRELGWIQTVGVRRLWRQRGLGLALLYHAFAEFRRRGLKRAALGVDAGSLTGATRLYERVGMTVKHEHTIFEKELRPGVELGAREEEA